MSLKNKRILFVSNSDSNRKLHLLDAASELDGIVAEALFLKDRQKGLINKIYKKMAYLTDVDGINYRLIRKCEQTFYDYIIIVKGEYIHSRTLHRIKKSSPFTKLIFWSQDNMFSKRNSSVNYRSSMRVYDAHVTQKVQCLDEYASQNIKNVLLQDKAYSPKYHVRPYRRREYTYDVTFIGYGNDERFQLLTSLTRADVRVNIFGGGWENYASDINLKIRPFELWGADYCNAIHNSKINLGLLRHSDADSQTSRSIEIPACGGFMLAERSTDHMRLFVENQEVVLFGDENELIKKVKYYLKNPDERERIADRGYSKINQGGFKYSDRLKEIIEFSNGI